MLGCVTVAWKAFVNTEHWMLHHIMLSAMSMLQQVFSCATRALYWARALLVVTLGCDGWQASPVAPYVLQ